MPQNPFAQNPMSKYELRLAREKRRLAKVELHMAEVEKMSSEDIAIPKAIKTVVIGLVILFAVITIAGCADGVIKNYHVQKNRTICEQAAAQAGVEADCILARIKAKAKASG